jgi:Na+-translocating ferredoxin:NAD+ oxidoreductase RnfD subunit
MLDPRRIVIPAVVCVSLAACDSLTAPSRARNAADPSGPLFDGGHMLGSGAFVDTTNATTATPMNGAAAGDSTGRGGHMLGSGA